MRPLAALCLASALTLALAASPARAGEIVTLVSDVYCPFNCEPGAGAPGYVIEVAQKAFAAKGITVVYKVVSWDAALEATRKGQYDAVIGALRSDAPDFVFPTSPMGASRFVLIVRKDDPWRYAGAASLAGKKLGLVDGYTYWDVLEKHLAKNPGADVRVKGEDPLDLNVKNLLTKKVDVVVEDSVVFQYKSGRLKLGAMVEKAGEAETAGEMFLAFSPAKPGSKANAKTFSEGIEALRKSGELATILKKYGVKDWK